MPLPDSGILILFLPLAMKNPLPADAAFDDWACSGSDPVSDKLNCHKRRA
jgi:hypothetical protein